MRSALIRLLSGNDSEDEDHINDELFGTIEPWRIATAAILCWLITSCAVAAGIGGGGLLVPMYTLVLGIDAKSAVPISKSTIFGVAVGNAFYITRQRHPHANRPLIDYATVMLMQPGELTGVIIGVLLNLFLPEVIIVILLVVVLGFNSYVTLKKGRARWKKETELKLQQEQGEDTAASTTEEDHVEVAVNGNGTAAIDDDDDEAAAAAATMEGQSNNHDHHQHPKHVRPMGSDIFYSRGEDMMDDPSEEGPPQEEPRNGHSTPHDDAAAGETNGSATNDKDDEVNGKNGTTTSNGVEESNAMEEPLHDGADEMNGENNNNKSTNNGDEVIKSREMEEQLERIEEEEAVQFPIAPYVTLAAMTAFLIFYSLLLNEVIVQDNIDNCLPGYWALYCTPIIVYGAIVYYCGRRNIRRYRLKEELGFEFVDGDVHWSAKAVRMLVPAAYAAGIAAGLLGIGGGMILGPLFVSLNFQPQVGTASTGFMILFTALAGTVQYLAVGKLPWRYALWFGSIGAIGGQTGQRVVRRMIERTGRPSIAVILLGIIIALAVIVMAASGITNVVQDANDGEDIWEVDTGLFVCDRDD